TPSAPCRAAAEGGPPILLYSLRKKSGGHAVGKEPSLRTQDQAVSLPLHLPPGKIFACPAQQLCGSRRPPTFFDVSQVAAFQGPERGHDVFVEVHGGTQRFLLEGDLSAGDGAEVDGVV